MFPIIINSPARTTSEIGERAKARRLSLDMSRETLSKKAGVPSATIKRFESTGNIGLAALVQIMMALGCADDLAYLFQEPPLLSLEQLNKPLRLRGRK